MDCWLFGYGSVIWRPSFPFVESRPAIARDVARRHHQASEYHRGVPGAPGRVVTLVAHAGGRCLGLAYRIARDEVDATIAHLDVREQGGYARTTLAITLDDGRAVEALSYVAEPGNSLDLGSASVDAIVAQVARARGPSGANAEYVLRLAEALRALRHPAIDADEVARQDLHLFAIESRVRALTRA
ncbi:MAG: gamma-glutamylcyclotransferase [Polyangiales bacterium]